MTLLLSLGAETMRRKGDYTSNLYWPQLGTMKKPSRSVTAYVKARFVIPNGAPRSRGICFNRPFDAVYPERSRIGSG
jgi:hypothetical protein